MSKINAFRVVNLNYNNNSIRIEDETYDFNGESTLLSLQNGGGKSVLVQMMLAPFVRKRYRDTPDRPFASYFTTNKPTFLLVEWSLDGGAGYVLTGMMVRQKQNNEEGEDGEELEMINLIHEYSLENSFDLRNIPIIEMEGKVRKLKGFNACRTMFEEQKKARGYQFQCFDLTQSNQQRQYFLRLKEYGINHEEWETIIKKINLKESGLSELFKEAKDEAGLIEKWFLPAVESKLNQDGNRMKQFQSILLKFIGQYKENQSKIERKDTILKFNEDAALIIKENSSYLEASKQMELQQEKLAYLRSCLKEMEEIAKLLVEESNQRLACYEEEIKEIRYEECSYTLYQIMDALESYLVSSEQYEREMEVLNAELKATTHKLHIQECARIYQDYLSESKEVLELENKLEVVKKDEKELLPERENIGYSLRLYYEKQVKEQQARLEQTQLSVQKMQEQEQESKQLLVNENKQLGEYSIQLGQLKERTSQYSEKEAAFNMRFSQNFNRNIIGTYEEGWYEVFTATQEKILDETVTKHRILSQQKLNLQQQIDAFDSNREDISNRLGRTSSSLEEKERQYKGQQTKLKERIEKMRYLNLPETMKWETDQILNAFDQKIDTLEQVQREFEQQLNDREDEYRKLKSGEVLTLPKEFETLLSDMGAHYVFGMEWLKKNEYSERENRLILEKNPMIPYSLILSDFELNRLMLEEVNFYTSYPIPIIRREDLTKEANGVVRGIYQTGHLSLFVAFNQHLLNEEALQVLLNQKVEEIEDCQGKIDRKKKEVAHYRDIKNTILYQNLNKQDYDMLYQSIEEEKVRKEEFEKEIGKLRADKANAEKDLKQIESSLDESRNLESKIREMLQATLQLKSEYEDYLNQRIFLDSLKKRIIKCEDKITQLNQTISHLGLELEELLEKRREESAILNNSNDKYIRFKNYQNGFVIEKDIEDLEARYNAITKEISNNLADLENQLKKANDRLSKVQARLSQLTDKYQLMETDFNQVFPDEYTVLSLEKLLEQKEKLKEQLSNRRNKLEKDIAVKESEKLRQEKELVERFEREIPCERSQIVDTEFKKRIKLVNLKITEESEINKRCTIQWNGYKANQPAMEEFTEFRTNQTFDFKEELFSYETSELGELDSQKYLQFQGERIREYRMLTNQRNRGREALSAALEKNLRKVDYHEDFFHRPLEAMKDMLDSPQVIHNQLEIVLQSYQTLMEKLQVDIAIIEKEGQKVLEMLLDYVEDIHKNLGKIDKNSNIMVKGRSIKMLKLNLPDWEEQLSVYELRLKDFLDNLTKRGLERLNQNGNIEELIGAVATTRNLYDSVVGISTITIRLFKIEAQREYPITWTDVSKNSGGEGFLSAFAVLSSLLSYIRRDETDIFTEREEGKVLVMDNPFAQTNASHLLIPLMDIAKKSNTQLICLTGLGGESIYNRFDNIYVLNLMESGLKQDIQYVTSDHVKGDVKLYKIATSRVQVQDMEQMELLF